MKELNSVLKSIKNKELLPIYFFYGEEPHFIDVAVKAFENDVLTEDEKAFNQTVIYGKDTTYSEILALARQFPMMGEKQVIIVKEAQEIRMTDKEAEALKIYAENPVETTLLVIAHKYKKPDARRAFMKALSNRKMLFESVKIKDWLVPGWIENELSVMGIKSRPNIPVLLSEYLGTDLSRISNELHKLKIILKEGEILDGKLIEMHIGISKDFNVFELLKALGKKDSSNAFRIAHYIGKNPKASPLGVMMSNLYNFFSNLIIYHTMRGEPDKEIATVTKATLYTIKDLAVAARYYNLKHCTRIISILRDIDLKTKGLGAVNMEEGELLKELVFKILNVDKTKVKT